MDSRLDNAVDVAAGLIRERYEPDHYDLQVKLHADSVVELAQAKGLSPDHEEIVQAIRRRL